MRCRRSTVKLLGLGSMVRASARSQNELSELLDVLHRILVARGDQRSEEQRCYKIWVKTRFRGHTSQCVIPYSISLLLTTFFRTAGTGLGTLMA